MKTVLLHVLNQILRRITVIAHLQREYLVILYQTHKPFITVMVINVIVPGKLQQATFDENVVRHTVTLNGFINPFRRKEKLCEDV